MVADNFREAGTRLLTPLARNFPLDPMGISLLSLATAIGAGYCFAKAALLAQAKLAEGIEETAFYKAKITTARFYFDRILPQATAAFLAIKSGKASMMDLEADAF